MEGPIEQGFRRRFREVLALVRPRRLEFGVELLVGRARKAAALQGIPLVQAFAEVYEFTRIRVERRLRLTGACSLVEPTWDRFRGTAPRFLCDASLGGLSRSLRASGYGVKTSALAGDSLCERAQATGRVLLTSDDALFDLPAPSGAPLTMLWIPAGLSVEEQQGLTLRDLGLALPEPASA